MDKKYLEVSGKDCECEANMSTRETIIAIIMIILFAVVYYGCDNGGSSSTFRGSGSSDVPVASSANIIKGVFVDSPVEGLNYQTETHAGITDSEGRFTCFEDEMITFMIGHLVLGQAPACEIITPMAFLDESAIPNDITHPMVTNMGRFLQSLDADGNPENGITLTEEVKDEISGRIVDFDQSIKDFENDADVVACFDVLNASCSPCGGQSWELCPAAQAQQHLNTNAGQYTGCRNRYNSSEDDPDGN